MANKEDSNVQSFEAIAEDHVRNIGIMAHIDAGKTTTSERILFYTGRTHKIGNIDDGNTSLDFMKQEQERGITIQSACTTCLWKERTTQEEYRINLIDTPGHVDFTAEVERSLRVLDGAVAVLDGKNGVEPQTETVWRQADKYNVPSIVYVNKLDSIGSDFEMSFHSIKEKLGATAIAIQYPLGTEKEFYGVIDLVKMIGWKWVNEVDPRTNSIPAPTQIEIPAEYMEKAQEWRQMMLDELANNDDEIMMEVLEGKEPTVEEIQAALRRGTISHKFHPVLAGASFRSKGIQTLLDAIVDYLPSPLDIPAAVGKDKDGNDVECKPVSDAPFVGLAFKITTNQFGKLTFFRVYSGTLKNGSYLYNATRNVTERVSRIVLMNADSEEDVSEVRAGEIAAIIGLKSTKTGDTLCTEENPIYLESIKFQDPLISEAIEADKHTDTDKMAVVLMKFCEEDPTFHFYTNKETGQSIIAGVGELQLDVNCTRLRDDYGIPVHVGAPQVAYKETIRKSATCEGKYIKQSGGHGQYGHVIFKFSPNPGKGIETQNEVTGGRIPKEFIKPSIDGLVEATAHGLVAGYPAIDIKAELMDGSSHPVDSSEAAYKMASSIAFKLAAQKCDPVILEPIVKAEITTPEQYLGTVLGDISSRRGTVTDTSSKGNAQVISALVPLANMFGYINDLRSMTQGRGIYTMEFAQYQEVPKSIQEQIVKARTGAGN